MGVLKIRTDSGEVVPVGGGGRSSIDLDTTLSVKGKAADAKAVGDAISELSGENANSLALTSPDGSVWDITITNEGVLTPVKRGGDAEPDDPVIPESPGNNVVEGRTLKITTATAPTADGRTLRFH